MQDLLDLYRRAYMSYDQSLLEDATGRDSLDVDEKIDGTDKAAIADTEARVKTLGLDDIPDRPKGPPGVVDEDAYVADAAMLMAKKSGQEFHDKWVTEGIPVDPMQEEHAARVAEDVQAWAEDVTLAMRLEQEQSRTQVYAVYLRKMITILGGEVPGPDDPAYDQELFGQAETALEALGVLKMNWDSVQPALAAQAARETPPGVAVHGRSEPGIAE